MVGFVLNSLCEDGRERMDSLQLVIRNDHDEREKSFPDGEQVIVSQELLGNHCLLDQIHLLPDIAYIQHGH